MKKNIKLMMALLLAITLGTNGAWAESVTFNVRSWDATNKQVVTTSTTKDCTVLTGNPGEWMMLGSSNDQNDHYYVVKGNVTVQAQVKYCMTFDDFVADKWEKADGASVEPISAAKRRLVQSSDFHIVSGDESLSDMLNKKAYAVMVGDTLYVNCRHYRYQGVQFGPGYAYGFRYDGNKLCIVNRKIGRGELMAVGVVGAVTPGVGTSAVVGAAEQEIMLANKVCYLVDSEPNKKGITKIKYINEKFINAVLGDNEGLKSQYNAAGGKQSRQSAANTLRTLKAAGLIK